MLYTFHKTTASLTSLEENKPTESFAGEKKIGLLKREGKVYAFAALCPHASVPLCDGWADLMGHIVCPKHKYRFDPATGRNTTGEGYKLFTYRTEIRDNDIYVELLDEISDSLTKNAVPEDDVDVDRW